MDETKTSINQKLQQAVREGVHQKGTNERHELTICMEKRTASSRTVKMMIKHQDENKLEEYSDTMQPQNLLI